jgi:hypothetical protein
MGKDLTPPMTDGVDITLRTPEGLKVVFVPFIDSSDLRSFGKRAKEAMQPYGFPELVALRKATQ